MAAFVFLPRFVEETDLEASAIIIGSEGECAIGRIAWFRGGVVE